MEIEIVIMIPLGACRRFVPNHYVNVPARRKKGLRTKQGPTVLQRDNRAPQCPTWVSQSLAGHHRTQRAQQGLRGPSKASQGFREFQQGLITCQRIQQGPSRPQTKPHKAQQGLTGPYSVQQDATGHLHQKGFQKGFRKA